MEAPRGDLSFEDSLDTFTVEVDVLLCVDYVTQQYLLCKI